MKNIIKILKTKADTALYRYKKSKDKPLSEINDKYHPYLETLSKDGIVVVDNFYSKEECEAFKAEVDSLMIKFDSKLWKDKEESDSRIYGIEKYSELIQKFSNNEMVKSVGEHYLNTQLKLNMTLAGMLKFKQKNLGSGGGWHRDTVNVNAYKSIMYLSDVNEESGPFTYVKGSHTDENVISSIRHCGIGYNQNRLTEKEVDSIINKFNLVKQVYIAKAGTLILVDTRGIHIGAPIQKGTRYALTNYFSAAFNYDNMMMHSNKVLLKP